MNLIKQLFILGIFFLPFHSFCQGTMNRENLFGENSANYHDNSLTYILDYQPQNTADQQILYKVFKITAAEEEDGETVYTALYSNDEYPTSGPIYTNKHKSLAMVRVNRATETIPAKTEITFKVVHINRYIYNVSVQGSTDEDLTPPPSFFTDFFTGTTGDILRTLSAKIKPQDPLVKKEITEYSKDKGFPQISSGSLENEIGKLVEDLQDFNTAYLALEDQRMQIYGGSCTEFADCPDYSKQFSALITQRNLLERDLTNMVIMLKPNLETKVAKLESCLSKFKTLQSAKTTIKQKENLISYLSSVAENLRSEYELLRNDANTSEEVKKAFGEDITKVASQIATARAELIAQETIINLTKKDLISSCSTGTCESNDTCWQEEQESITKEKIEKEAMLDFINTLDSFKKALPSIEDIRKLQRTLLLANRNSQQYTATILKLDNALNLNIDLDIKANDSVKPFLTLPFSSNCSINYDFPITKYWYFTFSSGTFLGIGNYRTITYEWQKLPGLNGQVSSGTDGFYQLARAGRRPSLVGFQSLGHLLYRCSPNVSLGMATGVGLSLENNPRLAYMLGGTLALGRSRQLCLNAGVLLAQSQELKNNLYVDVPYAANTTSIEYYNRYRLGGFISITFTPFVTQETQEANQQGS